MSTYLTDPEAELLIDKLNHRSDLPSSVKIFMIVSTLLLCQGCEDSVESQTVPIGVQGGSDIAAKVEGLLESNPHIVHPETGGEYTMQIIKPDPNKEYCMLQVTPDPIAHYTMKFVGPKAQQLNKKLDPKLREAIVDSLKQRIETSEEP